MCRFCDRSARYRNDNKYFSTFRHMKLWAFAFWVKVPIIADKKGHNKYKKRKDSKHVIRKHGGWMRKGNGIFQWDKL